MKDSIRKPWVDLVEDQTFSYLIVIDFESTCWKDKKNTSQEIIEFPAVLLDTSNGQIESEFQHYVMPDEHPILSEFCTEFTGITQEQVENGVPLFICLNKFTAWLKRIESEKNVAYNRSTDDAKKLCTFVTWSDWDLGVCLHYECQRKQLYKPSALNHWIDARAVYRNFYQRKPKGLNGALQEVGIEFSGRQHSGLDDAKNTARLVWRMIQDGCHLKITKTIQSGTLKAVPRALPQPGQGQQLSKTSSSKPISTSSSCPNSSVTSTALPAAEVNNGTCSKGDEGNKRNTAVVPTVASSVTATSSSSSCVKRAAQSDETEESRSTSSKTRKKSCEATGVKGDAFRIYVDGPHEAGGDCIRLTSVKENQALNERNSKTSCTKDTPGVCPSKIICGNAGVVSAESRTPTNRSAKSGEFKTPPVGCPLPFYKQNSLEKYGKLGERTSPGDVFKTPAASKATPGAITTKGFKTPANSSPGISMTKITPPMCKCGRRSKRRVAARPGPNQGRAFYSCPGQRRAAGLKDTTNAKHGCGYFSWESMLLSEFGSPNAVSVPGFTAPGSISRSKTPSPLAVSSVKMPRNPSPLAMGSIQRAISQRTGQNNGSFSTIGITPFGVGNSNTFR